MKKTRKILLALAVVVFGGLLLFTGVSPRTDRPAPISEPALSAPVETAEPTPEPTPGPDYSGMVRISPGKVPEGSVLQDKEVIGKIGALESIIDESFIDSVSDNAIENIYTFQYLVSEQPHILFAAMHLFQYCIGIVLKFSGYVKPFLKYVLVCHCLSFVV